MAYTSPEEYAITYTFLLPEGSREEFHIRLDSRTMDLGPEPGKELPSWTRLEFHQCPNCPLDPADTQACPLAGSLVSVVDRFDGLLSYEKLYVEVRTIERTVSQETTVQRGIGSLLGLIIAASGCPHTSVFKPMARFHLPLASADETVYRASSMYLLAQYFLRREGRPAELDLTGLQRIYDNMQIINTYIVKRLRSATGTDSLVNSVIVLDIYAKTLELAIEDALARIRHLFLPFIE
jgi:hypothetical protein